MANYKWRKDTLQRLLTLFPKDGSWIRESDLIERARKNKISSATVHRHLPFLLRRLFVMVKFEHLGNRISVEYRRTKLADQWKTVYDLFIGNDVTNERRGWSQDWKPKNLAEVQVKGWDGRISVKYPANSPENWMGEVILDAIKSLAAELSKMYLGQEHDLHALHFIDRKNNKRYLITDRDERALEKAVKSGNVRTLR